MTATKRPGKPSAEARVRRARKIAREATVRAELILADESAQRSTRSRAAYKTKAVALDAVLEALRG